MNSKTSFICTPGKLRGKFDVRVGRPVSRHREYTRLVSTRHMCSSRCLLPELLSKSDENSFGPPDVAQPIRVLVLDHFADEFPDTLRKTRDATVSSMSSTVSMTWR